MSEVTNPRSTAAPDTVTVLAETRNMRFSTLTLTVGETVPWHCHSKVSDWYLCMEGELKVETRAPRQAFELAPGAMCKVEPKTAHRAVNQGKGECRFALVQGVGAYDFIPVGGMR